LADAENELYNIQLDAANEYGEKVIQAQQDLANALIEIETKRQEDSTYSEEEYQSDKARIVSEYTDLITTYSKLYGIAQEEDSRVVEDAWINAYSDIINSGDSWQNAVTQYVDKVDTAF
jgi:hypothetical protein